MSTNIDEIAGAVPHMSPGAVEHVFILLAENKKVPGRVQYTIKNCLLQEVESPEKGVILEVMQVCQ